MAEPVEAVAAHQVLLAVDLPPERAEVAVVEQPRLLRERILLANHSATLAGSDRPQAR